MNKKVKKELKKQLTGVSLFFAVLFLVIGAAIGFVVYGVLNSGDKTTKIELVGDSVVVVELDSSYEDEGATFIIKGVDYKDDVVVDNKVDTTKEGTYLVTYKLNNDLYNIELQRIVNVGGASNGE